MIMMVGTRIDGCLEGDPRRDLRASNFNLSLFGMLYKQSVNPNVSETIN